MTRANARLLRCQTATARRAALAVLLVFALAAVGARADPAPLATPAPDEDAPGLGWKDAALFAGGFATAFAAHEAGHTIANFALGNAPHVEHVSFLGAVPFFAVSPDIDCFGELCLKRDGSRFPTGQRGLLLILLAGFDVQHFTDEALLTADPALRRRHAPFRAGLLAFNTLTSAAYVLGNLGGFEPDAGDLHAAFRDTRAPRGWTTGLLLGIALLDGARWLWPDAPWLAQVSRAAKVSFLGLPLAL